MKCFKSYYVHVCVHTYSNSIKTSFLTKEKKGGETEREREREERKKREIKTMQNVGYVLLTTWMYFGPKADKHSTILENTVKCSRKC